MLSKSEDCTRYIIGLCCCQVASLQDQSLVNTSLCNKIFSENNHKQVHPKKK